VSDGSEWKGEVPMPLFPAALIAFSLLGAGDETTPNPPKDGEIAPETRIEPKTSDSDREIHGRFMLGVRLHGPRFKIQGEGTREKPFLLDLPLGDFLKIRIVTPDVSPCPWDGNLDD
jgi:hypothetical protein